MEENITTCMVFFQNLQEKDITSGEQMWISIYCHQNPDFVLHRAPRIFPLLPACRYNSITLSQACHAQLSHLNHPSLILSNNTENMVLQTSSLFFSPFKHYRPTKNSNRSIINYKCKYTYILQKEVLYAGNAIKITCSKKILCESIQ